MALLSQTCILIIFIIGTVACHQQASSNSFCQAGQYNISQVNHNFKAQETASKQPSSPDYIQIRPQQNISDYFITLSFGEPAQSVSLVLDTGSSNIILPGASSICPTCDTKGGGYSPSSTAVDLNKQFSISYSLGSGIVDAYTDKMVVPCSEAPAPRASFGVLTSSDHLEGVLGLAYQSLAVPAEDPMVPFYDTFIESSQGKYNNVFAMTLCGQNEGSSVILGHSDERIDRQSIAWTPLIEESYYVVDARYLQVSDWEPDSRGEWLYKKGATTVLGDFFSYNPDEQSGVMTIVDSGTTFILLAPEIVVQVSNLMVAVNKKYNLHIPNEFWNADPASGYFAISIPSDSIAQFPLLQVALRGEESDLIFLPIYPETYFKSWTNNLRVFAIQNTTGIQILGQAFMENYYVEFDRANKRMGFGPHQGICFPKNV